MITEKESDLLWANRILSMSSDALNDLALSILKQYKSKNLINIKSKKD